MQPVSGKPISIKLDGQLGRALRQYRRGTGLAANEVVYRALICYWVKQRTPEATLAINTADLKTDEAWAAYLDKGEFDEPLGQ